VLRIFFLRVFLFFFGLERFSLFGGQKSFLSKIPSFFFSPLRKGRRPAASFSFTGKGGGWRTFPLAMSSLSPATRKKEAERGRAPRAKECAIPTLPFLVQAFPFFPPALGAERTPSSSLFPPLGGHRGLVVFFFPANSPSFFQTFSLFSSGRQTTTPPGGS